VALDSTVTPILAGQRHRVSCANGDRRLDGEHECDLREAASSVGCGQSVWGATINGRLRTADMRDLLLTTFVFGMLPFVLLRPEVGILLWYLFSYAVPHHLAYGFAYTFPFAQLIGLVTLAGWLISREKKRPAITPTVVLLVAFGTWVSITTVFALFPDVEKWRETVIKVGVAVFAIQIIRTPQRLRWLALVVALSIAFYGVKGGLFAIATGGGRLLHGPLDSPIEDNNDLALALVMVLPLLVYALWSVRATWLRIGFAGSIALSSVAVLASYSRGGFVALCSVGLYFWLKSRRKFLIAMMLAIGIAGAWSFMPDKWFQRMDTISTYGEDRSVVGRFDAWRHAVNVVAARPLIGGGFGAFSPRVFAEFSPGIQWRAAHSIYFESLGEQGIVGLLLSVGIWLSAFRDARQASRLARGRPDQQNIAQLATMLQVSLVGYAIGGAFLSLAYFELFYGLALMSAAARLVVADLPAGAREPSSSKARGARRNGRRAATTRLVTENPQ
jgi:putative inorganic carbon (HCO3(-)) transporter